MADKKISELTNITGANLADADEFVVVDTSANETKAITYAELKSGLDTSTGFVRVTGDAMTGNLSFGDNNKAIFGAGSDLQIYHDGLNSYITDAGTGDLKIRGAAVSLETGGGNLYFKGDANVATLYHTNLQKLATTSTGVDVTGTVTADGLVVDGAAVLSGQLRFNDTNYWIDNSGGTDISYRSGGTHQFYSGGFVQRLNIASNGDISFYEDTGTTPKFFWDASAEALGIGTSSISTGNDLQLYKPDLPRLAFTNSSATGSYWLDKFGVNARLVNTEPSGSVTISTAGTERMRIDASGNVAIGATSTSAKLHVQGSAPEFRLYSDTTTGSTINFIDQGWQSQIQGTAGNLLFKTGGTTERLRIDSSGRVGVGTTSPSQKLHLVDSDPKIQLTRTSDFYYGQLSADGFSAFTNTNGAAPVIFKTATSERMRIDSSGNVGIGRTPTSHILEINGELKLTNLSAGQGIDFFDTTSAQVGIKTPSNSVLSFETNSTERMRIDSSGNVGIGTSSPSSLLAGANNLVVGSGSGEKGMTIYSGSTSNGNLYFANGTVGADAYRGFMQYNHASNYFRIGTAGSERLRIDSSGNLLVGTTTTYNGTAGTHISPEGFVGISRNGLNVAIFNRNTSDGDIVTFRKDNTTVGSIGSYFGDLYIASPSSTDAGLGFGASNIRPVTTTGASRDAAVDLGRSSARFNDIYATNGTIQTSDANEKQDIDVMSDAEQRVAVACKGLLRKFRWKDAVAEKGDAARIHFGIIAQDLKVAFEAEGLDAGNYAMFIHSTWTDEETGEERSRMGVRYPELLAFIIAAL